MNLFAIFIVQKIDNIIFHICKTVLLVPMCILTESTCKKCCIDFMVFYFVLPP